MTQDQSQNIKKLSDLQEYVSNDWMIYWLHYSNIGTWQFWFNALLIVVPLIVLFFLIDRRKALLMGFFGFNVHVWFNYIDIWGLDHGRWIYPFRTIPFLPTSIGLDASLVPVAYMLVYQWVINHNKNYYLYMIGLSIFFAFIFKPIMTTLELFRMFNWNYFGLFLGYLGIGLLSKWITNIFLRLQRNTKEKV